MLLEVGGTPYVITAAHVIDGCLRTQIEYDGISRRVDLLGESALLDVALLKSPVATNNYLALRADPDIVLGERVAAAGFTGPHSRADPQQASLRQHPHPAAA